VEDARGGYNPAAYGDAFADVYDDWYGDAGNVDATVEGVLALAHGGPVLELGIGTGRVALPLAAAGAVVWGLDGSEAMTERLRAKPGGGALPVAIGDMAAADLTNATVVTPEGPVPAGPAPPFAVVFAGFNTLCNLVTEDAQARCLRSAAAALAPDGVVAIELFVPVDEAVAGPVTQASSATADGRVLSISRQDAVTQQVIGEHVELDGAGRVLRRRPWTLRYVTLDQLDAMARAAGLELVDRWAGWDRTPFDERATSHVSVYGASRDGRERRDG
jgi:SAM-dependent methyltransferase